LFIEFSNKSQKKVQGSRHKKQGHSTSCFGLCPRSDDIQHPVSCIQHSISNYSVLNDLTGLAMAAFCFPPLAARNDPLLPPLAGSQ